VTFDAARGERALRQVKRLAHEHGFQVLFLTCSDRFDALADELVKLPGPSNERVLANPRPAAQDVPPADALQPTLRFEPDPRPNPDPVAPRRPQPEEVVSEPLFGSTASEETASGTRLAALRASRAAAGRDEGEADPLESLRRNVQDPDEDGNAR
jgi:hypothetical protein